MKSFMGHAGCCSAMLDHKNESLLVALALSLVVQPVVSAERGGALDSAASVPGLEEIVVTARKRVESAQDVPIAITTLGAAKLQELGAGTMSELVTHVPNFNWDPVGVNALSSWGLRGIVAQSRNAGQESGLGIYVDGVYTGRASSFNSSLTDIDRVEVLRGPQGSLYGRNTIAGAINITTKRPTDELGLVAGIRVGNYERRDVELGVSGPLVDGLLSGKLSAFRQESDGYVRNLADGSRLLDDYRIGGRAGLYWTPSEDLEIQLAADFLHQDHRPAFGLAADSQLSQAVPNWYFEDRFVTNQNDRNFEKIDAGGGSLTVNWTLLSGFTLTSISAARVNDFDMNNDDDAGPLSLTHSHFIDKSDLISQELRLTSPKQGRYDYVVGLYYMDERVRSNRHTAVVPYPAEDLGIVDTARVQTRSYAAFGSINYELTDTWTVGLGLRYTNDKKTADFMQTVNVPLGFSSSVVAFPDVSRDDTQVSGDVTLTWQPIGRFLTYGTVRKGFKSGGFQTDIIDFSDLASFSFEPETAVTYELGLKNESAQRTLRMNAAVFDTEYRDMQVSQLVGLGFSTRNAGRSRIRGLEVEIDYLAMESLTLGLSGGLLDAKYLEFPNCDAAGLGLDCSGNRLQFTPRWNLGVTLDYRQSVSRGAIVLHGDATSRGDQYSDAVNSDGIRALQPGTTSWPLKVSGYTLVGARLGFESDDKTWGVYLWGKNLTNRDYDLRRWRYPITPAIFGGAGAQGIEFVPGQPRTWGLEFSYQR